LISEIGPVKPVSDPMAEGAGLVSVDQKLLVEEQQLAKQFDLLNLVVRQHCNAVESFGLDRVDFHLDPGHLVERRR
jgi:hypothetical protein